LKATLITRETRVDVEDSLEKQLGFRIVGEGSMRFVRVSGIAKGRMLVRPAHTEETRLWDSLVKAHKAMQPKLKGRTAFQVEGFLTGYVDRNKNELHIRDTFHEKYLDAIKESDIEDLNPIRVMIVAVTDIP
jgi:hypothetical protein